MINSVTFAGREECLTKQIKQAATKAPEYFSPFSTTGLRDTAKSSKKIAEPMIPYFDFLPENTISAKKVSGDTIAEAYKAANGIY